jgi:derlin-1
MASNDIGDWYRNIPMMTKYWFSGSVIFPLLGKIGLLSIQSMVLHFHSLIYRFQIWRPVTALFFYPITPQTGFHYLMNLYFLYSYSSRLETGVFDGKPADYLFMLFFNWFALVIIGLFASIPLLMDPMVLSVLYVWCQFNKDQVVSFWFGTHFKAMYLPWILLAFNFIAGSGGWYEFLGIVVGHLYFYVMYKYPQDFGGRQFIQTPSFLYTYLPNRRGGVSGFGMPPASNRRPAEGDANRRHAWGQGNPLGGN